MQIYKIPVGAILVLRDSTENEDLVLFDKDKQYFLGVLQNNKVVELITKAEINTADINIIGCVILKIENIRY